MLEALIVLAVIIFFYSLIIIVDKYEKKSDSYNSNRFLGNGKPKKRNNSTEGGVDFYDCSFGSSDGGSSDGGGC